MLVCCTLPVLLVAWFSPVLEAEDEARPKPLPPLGPATTEALEGLQPRLAFGGTASYSHTKNVVGAVDGPTLQLGVIVDGALVLRDRRRLWTTTLKLVETQTRTPQVPLFIKSADELDLATTFGYRLGNARWLGPFVSASARAPLFRAYDIRENDRTILRKYRDDSTAEQDVLAQHRIPLTGPLEPLVLRETLGVFADPLDTPARALIAKLGLGLQHVVVGDGFALADDSTTTELELKQLRDVTEVGTLLDLEARGTVATNLTWSLRASFFYPLYADIAVGESGLESLSSQVGGKLSLRLVTWASLDYSLSLERTPVISEQWQVQNGLSLRIGYDLL